MSPSAIDVDRALTTLPRARDEAAHDEVPRIAVAVGASDPIHQSLTKLGIREFDLYGEDGSSPSKGLPLDLLNAPERLAGYHILLLPCQFEGGSCTGPTDAQKQNLLRFVDAGGKLYATDYSYEFVRQTWPGYLTWAGGGGEGAEGDVGYACGDLYSAPGRAVDKDLAAWLVAIGESNFELRDSKCGRVLFSTYHAEGDSGSELIAQEKALLYVVLEVGVCVSPPPPIR